MQSYSDSGRFKIEKKRAQAIEDQIVVSIHEYIEAISKSGECLQGALVPLNVLGRISNLGILNDGW